MLNFNTAKAVEILKEKNIIDEDMKGVLLVKDCVLIEKFTGKSYAYTLYNYHSDEKKYIGHSKKQATKEALIKVYPKLIEKSIVNSITPKGEELIRFIFEVVFKHYGYVVREGQIELSINMYTAMKNKNLHMSDVAVGFGKTHAYLVAGIVYQFELSIHSKTMIVSTSSKQLQKAIVEEYLPDISKMLLEFGIIDREIKVALRKGKDNYICQKKLNEYISTLSRSKKSDSQFNALLELKRNKSIDLDKATEISKYDRAKIKLQGNECRTCPRNHVCPYLLYMKKALGNSFDFQICNHNYFTVDAKNKHTKNNKALLPAYSAVIIDEAHKLNNAAIQTYSSILDFEKIRNSIQTRNKKNSKSKIKRRLSDACKVIQNICFETESMLFKQIESSEDKTKYTVRITKPIQKNLKIISKGILSINKIAISGGNYSFRRILNISTKIDEFLDSDNITYIENVNGNYVLVGVPKNINSLIKKHLFNDNHSVVMTSGTLAANEDFGYIKTLLGLNAIRRNISYITKNSPFNYMDNSLIYTSTNTIYPNLDNEAYIKGLASEIDKLIRASNGHALVLFTSYSAMRTVYDILRKKEYSFPIFKTSKGNGYAISKFRNSSNAVLFGCGSLWEGMNFEGDKLSHLIITKLPFLIPDPITEYKQSELRNFGEYKNQILIPQMLLKLKQGHGRAIRTETDTAVISILDCRVNSAYKEPVLNALPMCKVTSDLETIKRFFREKKTGDYWRNTNDTSSKFSRYK